MTRGLTAILGVLLALLALTGYATHGVPGAIGHVVNGVTIFVVLYIAAGGSLRDLVPAGGRS